MTYELDERIARLLTQLESPNLAQSEIDTIEKKIKILQELKQPAE